MQAHVLTQASVWRRLRRGPAALLVALALASSAAAAQPMLPAAGNCPPATEVPTPAQVDAARSGARDHGFLWRISKGGRSSWLYGTIHVGRLEWFFPGPGVAAALAASDLLALELDISDPAIVEALSKASAHRNDNSAAAPELPPALRARLERQVAAACMAPGALDALHPVMRAVTLGVLAARWEGLDVSYAQEIALLVAARGARLPLVSLETVEQQMGVLAPADAAQARQMVEQALDQLESGAARTVAARLARTWAESRLDELADHERWCDCADTDEERAVLRRLNDERNPVLARRIDTLHREGRRVFAAVGALHMTGPKALTVLMAQQGYSVERIEFGR